MSKKSIPRGLKSIAWYLITTSKVPNRLLNNCHSLKWPIFKIYSMILKNRLSTTWCPEKTLSSTPRGPKIDSTMPRMIESQRPKIESLKRQIEPKRPKTYFYSEKMDPQTPKIKFYWPKIDSYLTKIDSHNSKFVIDWYNWIRLHFRKVTKRVWSSRNVNARVLNSRTF